MNWSLIVLGLVALTSAAFAENSYLIIVPKLLKVGYDNQVSVFIAAASQPVEVKFDLMMGRKRIEGKTTCKPGETCNAKLTLPREFPIGAGELTVIGTGGLRFEERRDVIIYDNRHVLLVQTSASTYRPSDTMEVRVLAMNENLMPMEDGEMVVEIYDAALKLVQEFPRVPIRSGLTDVLRLPIAEHCNFGAWLVSATIENTTSSVEVLVARPVTPSFDFKTIVPRFLLRTEKMLRGVIEIADDEGKPTFGRGMIAIGPMTEQEMEVKMKMELKPEKMREDEWRKWKSLEFDVAGRMEFNYDLLSMFNIDVTKCIAIQIYCQITDIESGQERIIRQIIPIFTRDIMYDIRPLEFQAGMKNEFEVIAKRPDGKPVKMEDVIVTVRMMMGDEHGKRVDEKLVEIKDFYTRGRNDIGMFNIEIPDSCIGVLMTITPMNNDVKMRGYRTHAVPLMPVPRYRDTTGAKLSIELLPSTVAPVNTNVDVPVVSTQMSTVGKTSNFYVQLIPSKSVEKFERLPMSYVLMTNGRITLTGEFFVEPTKECQTKTPRTIRPEEQMPPTCVFNGTLPILITREMVPYSTLLVYTFQPTFGFHVVESYRFSVAGLFQSQLTLNATIVPFKPVETMVEMPHFMHFMDDMKMKPIRISDKAQDRTRVELSFTGVPDSTVGLHVLEYDAVLQGLTTEITKERLLKYLTTYEQVPLVSMPTMPPMPDMKKMPKVEMHSRELRPDVVMEDDIKRSDKDSLEKDTRMLSEKDEEDLMHRERMGHKVRYPIEKMFFGVSTTHSLPMVEGDDFYTTSHMGRYYGDERRQSASVHYRRRLDKTMNQYDITVGDDNDIMTTSMPLVLTANLPKSMSMPMPMKPDVEKMDSSEMLPTRDEKMMHDKYPFYGTPSWFEKMHTKLNSISHEAFMFMQSGLAVISDFSTLRIPSDMKHENFMKLFTKFREYPMTVMNGLTLGVRDQARQLLEEYIAQTDLSMIPPPIMFEEQARTGYYRSVFFNTSRIESQGMGKVILPPVKPYSTWLATGFALNTKSGLSIAQPIRLPTDQGLFVLGDCPKHVRVGERVLLTLGVNNYLGKDVSNVMVRIRASGDFDLMEETKPDQIISMKDKDYTFTIPSLKTWGVEMRNMIFVPKRCGVMQIIIEVESEFGGDYEVLPIWVGESGMKRKEVSTRLFDLTTEKKTFGPIVEKITESPNLRSVIFGVTGTGLDRFVKKYTMETNGLVGIDRALVRLYRSLGLRRYLNETMQKESPLFKMTFDNITRAYQQLQLYNDYDGSYSFISDEGVKHSSLYLTSLAFGAMISPMMPFRDNVTLNRTLNWILMHQKEDGSFDDVGPCFHYRFCTGEFRRESLTAIVLYSLTHHNAYEFMPEFIRRRLFDGENCPINRAQRYLISRVPDVKPNLLTISLFEMAFIQNRALPTELRTKIQDALLSRKLTVVPEDNSKFLKIMDDKMTFDDQLLVNAMTVSLYAYFNDWKTTSDMARWVVDQVETHPFYDTVLDAVFRTEAWLNVDCLFRRQFGTDKFMVTVEVSADNGEKKVFKIDPMNMDVTQMMKFTLPCRQITYTVSGFGICAVRVLQIFAEMEPKPMEPMPFQLTQELLPMPWLNEIKAKTCMTYTPTAKDRLFVKDDFNRTMVIEAFIPSGMRINVRQMGFFLSRIENVMDFVYLPHVNKVMFFINVPSTVYGKPICLEWCLERLSTVMNWAPMEVRVYDYLQQETKLVRLMPMKIEPSMFGYKFVEAVHKARPSLETLYQKPTKF